MEAWVDLGGIEARTLVVSRFKLDGGAMFGQVPKPLWSRYSKADDLNRIPLVVRSLLLRTPEALVLVEAGMGENFGASEAERLALEPVAGGLDDALRTEDIDPRAVTHLILTHLHFDHAAGVARRGAGGAPVPALPHARVYVQRSHWERAHAPGIKEKRSFRPEDLAVMEEMGVELIDGEGEILPRISVRLSSGHTDALQIVIVRGKRETLYYPSDLIPTLAHVRAAYTMGFDQWPNRLIEEKVALLADVAADDGLLVFVHDPDTVAARIQEGAHGYSVRCKETL